MTIDNNNPFNFEPNVGDEDFALSETDDLLHSDISGPRLFIRNDGKDTTFVGIVMSETKDSFLVALPCRVLTKDGKYTVAPLSLAPYQRLLKFCHHTVMYPCPPFNVQYYIYLKSLEDIDPVVKPFVDDAVEDFEDMLHQIKGSREELPTTKSSDTEELQEYLTSKFEQGSVITNGSTSKN